MDRLALFRRSDERGLVPGTEPQVRLGLILSHCFCNTTALCPLLVKWQCPRDPMERLGGCDQTVLEAGEAIIIKTPTGGGYGVAEVR